MRWLSSQRAKIGFIAPSATLYLLFLVIPIGIAIYYSFTDFSGIGKAHFAGLANYRRMFSDRLFLVAARNTFVVLCVALVLLLVLSFLIALLLNEAFKSSSLAKAMVFSPYIIAPIIVGVIWSFILNPQFGLLNTALRAVGLDALALEWIGGKSLSALSIGIVFTWQMLGFHATIFLAGLRMIPQDVYEAAAIDGASKPQQIFRVTIPMLKETIVMNMVLIITGVFKVYELVVQLTAGGPNHLSELLTSYMYFTVFTSSKYGYGMAIAVFILVVSIAGSFLYVRQSHRKNRREG